MILIKDTPPEVVARIKAECNHTLIKSLETYRDPNVIGTHAARAVCHDGEVWDMVITPGDIEEVEFSSWPPTVNY